MEFSIFTDSLPDLCYRHMQVLRYDWDKSVYNSVCEYISAVNWLDVLTVYLNTDSLWSAFSNVLQTAIDLYVPKKAIRNCANVKYRCCQLVKFQWIGHMP